MAASTKLDLDPDVFEIAKPWVVIYSFNSQDITHMTHKHN